MELNNDSSAARQKFIQAEQIYSLVLDTLSVSSDKKQLIILNKALNLRLLGKDEEANQIFEEINLKAENDITKQLMVTFQRMTRKDVIEFYIVAANDKSPTR